MVVHILITLKCLPASTVLEAKQQSAALSSNLKLQDQKTQVSFGNCDKVNCHHASSTTLITFYRYAIHSVRNPRSKM